MDKKVLVAESDSTVLQVISYFLNLEGFEVTTVADGAVVLDVVVRFMPDVILLDPALAGVNGVKLSRDIREIQELKDVPILYIVEDVDSLFKMGEEIPSGYGIIHKPIDPTRMVNTIKECMEGAKQSSFEQVEPMSIEELLGWSVSEDSDKKNLILENDPAVLDNNLSGIVGEEVLDDNIPLEVTERAIEETEEELEQKEDEAVMSEELTGGIENLIPTEVGIQTHDIALDSRFHGNDGLLTQATGMGHGPSDEQLENIISRLSREFIEKVVMEIVPRIAEEEIKKEIERLKGESG